MVGYILQEEGWSGQVVCEVESEQHQLVGYI